MRDCIRKSVAVSRLLSEALSALSVGCEKRKTATLSGETKTRMKVENDGFKMWSNYVEAIDNYTGGDDKQFGRYMRILCYYGIYGQEIAETEIEKLFFTGVKSSINASIQNIKNGMLGGRGKTAELSSKKPTLEEVKAYITEKKSKVDPQAFFDYYTKVGWVYGKNKLPIKDWKACVRTWERNSRPDNTDILHDSEGESL